MSFAAPFALAGLLCLPLIFFLLRLTPPAPRRVAFPPIALLRDLAATTRTPANIPLWIRLLRLLAATLLILGFAGPTLTPPPPLAGAGPVLLVIDNGWAAAAAWPDFIGAAQTLIAQAAAAHRLVAILPTAPPPTGPLTLVPAADAATAGHALAALTPQPWPPDRAAAVALLRAAPETTRIYLTDNIRTPEDSRFLDALRPTSILAAAAAPPLLGPADIDRNGALTVIALSNPAHADVTASTADGAILAHASFTDQTTTIDLPALLSRQIGRLSLGGPPSAGGVTLLGAAHSPPTAGLHAGSANADTPYLGTLYYLARALPAGTPVTTGALAPLIASHPSLLVLADTPLAGDDLAAANAYIRAGGTLLRFAGPLTAAAPDTLNPDPLLPGDRRLGGALTWATPEPMAPLPATSPLAGLATDAQATVSRQSLADPQTLDPATIWASLPDGTALILGRRLGRGTLIDVLTTANTDWSSLALSGLYPQLLARLLAQAAGAPLNATTKEPLYLALSADGTLAPPTSPAQMSAADLATARPSPATPPGLYGTPAHELAFNLGGHLAPLQPANWPGAIPLGAPHPGRPLGPALLVAALLLLMLDFALSLWLRGARPRLRTAALIALLATAAPAHAQQTPAAALQTTLAYIPGPDEAANRITADGLAALSTDVSAHSSVTLAVPAAVSPDTDDLAVYPLIYWLITPATLAPSPKACAALAAYMAHGGLLVIDQPGGDDNAPGSGAGFAPGSATALTRATACLALPPFEPLTTANVLAHSFFIIHDFPGRFAGAPVLIANPAARDADGVTPIIEAQNDWAGAWATDDQGNPEQTPIPGGEAQRDIALRFGVNLVIYALTGDYKADQNAAPALLDRLGQ